MLKSQKYNMVYLQFMFHIQRHNLDFCSPVCHSEPEYGHSQSHLWPESWRNLNVPAKSLWHLDSKWEEEEEEEDKRNEHKNQRPVFRHTHQWVFPTPWCESI
jgi:hypothetical protein